MTKLLIVDADSSVREVLVRLLSRGGFQVIAATNGVQAIAIAQAEQPRLILLDLSLPILDGWQTAGRLRASPETSAIPIIIISGDSLHTHHQLLASACDDFEAKPINFPRLIAKIRLLSAVGSA